MDATWQTFRQPPPVPDGSVTVMWRGVTCFCVDEGDMELGSAWVRDIDISSLLSHAQVGEIEALARAARKENRK